MSRMDRPEWAPSSIDIERPSAARMYDYYLGGSHNFAADRQAAEQVIAVLPDTRLVAQANRAFLQRCVAYLAAAGVRQFLDIGSGIPTLGNVHEVAEKSAPGSRVVYVDTDPVAVAHSRSILGGNPRAAAIQEDLRRPRDILEHPRLREVLDLDRPVAVLLMAVLHFVGDDDRPAEILATLRDSVVPGSHLAISHGTHEGREEEVHRLQEVYQRGGTRVTSRSRAEIAALFDGFEPVDPGVTWVPLWHPQPGDDVSEPQRAGLIGGLGRKPG
jgi:SAM-dependent methyltransferase